MIRILSIVKLQNKIRPGDKWYAELDGKALRTNILSYLVVIDHVKFLNFQAECDRQAIQVVDQFLKKRQFKEKVLTLNQSNVLVI